jgi:hypothetical protein
MNCPLLMRLVRRQHLDAFPPLALLAIVGTAGMVAADSLTPAVQVEPIARFMAGEVGVADEPQVGIKTGIGQDLTQSTHVRGNAASLGIIIGTCIGLSSGEACFKAGIESFARLYPPNDRRASWCCP